MKPISITADRAQRQVTVAWEDDHISTFPFSLLRAGCPCAQCRGGHEHMRDTPDPSVFTLDLPVTPATKLTNIVPVGSYAVALIWEDGHDAGIFKWEYLRALCPCEQCCESAWDTGHE